MMLATPRPAGLPSLPLPAATSPTPIDLGAPPRAGSAAAAEDLGVVKALQAARTPEIAEWAMDFDRQGMLDVWLTEAAALRPGAGTLGSVFATAAVVDAIAAAAQASEAYKQQVDRPRPFDADPAVEPLKRPESGSFPSGHAATAYAGARMLAALNPADADRYFSIAGDVAVSRVVAGVHFPSDVLAGARMGVQAADRIALEQQVRLAPVIAKIAAAAPAPAAAP